MKVPTLSAPAQGYAVLTGAGTIAVIVLWSFFRKQAKDAAGAISDINEGTPYAGAGVAGTLGNVTDQASGGLLSGIGEWIGGKLADVFQPYDPNAPQPETRKNAVADQFYNQGILSQ